MPDITLIRCHTFGGGWAIPETPEGAGSLFAFFGEDPAPLMPLGGCEGYIVEPQDALNVFDHLRDAGLEVEIA